MRNNGIEDILIGESYKTTKKSNKLLLFIIFLMIVLIGLVAFYFYYTSTAVSTKELFIKQFSNNNAKNITNFDIYEQLAEKFSTTNSEVTSSINFSTSKTNDDTQDIDLSKFVLDLSTKTDVQEERSYSELGIIYSDNDILRIKLLANKDKIGIASDEIVNKYVGVHYDAIKDTFGVEFDKNDLDEFANKEKIDLTEEERNTFIKESAQKALSAIPEEKFTIQNNIAIDKEKESVAVTAYTLTLTQEDFNNIAATFLNDLKNNTTLLEKLVTGNVVDEESLDAEQSVQLEPTSAIEGEENIEQPVDTIYEEFTEPEIEAEPEVGTQELQLEESIEIENQEPTIDVDTEGLSTLINIISLINGTKMDTTVEDIQNQIETLASEVNNYTGDVIIITVYASETQTEKITIKLPNNNSFDIEFLKTSDEENNITFTYLYKGGNTSVFSKEESMTYSAGDSTDNTQTNGYSFEIYRYSKDANNTTKAILSFIENEKINKKINFNLKTTGTSSSNSLKNNVVISFSTSDEEQQITIDNDINFSVAPKVDELTDENCLFMETLSPEDRALTMQAIEDKINIVVEQKKENLNMIDTNSNNTIIQQNANETITKDNAREALSNKIAELRNNASANQEEFTIQNLADLEIDGYEVSSNVSEEKAIIVIDVYTFNVDKEFNISDG